MNPDFSSATATRISLIGNHQDWTVRFKASKQRVAFVMVEKAIKSSIQAHNLWHLKSLTSLKGNGKSLTSCPPITSPALTWLSLIKRRRMKRSDP
ncbi:hypothetical protein MKX01_038395 [Papaver californicum]|nr:hypothetical protein MKX01_038395 [Papaver californicum]